MPFTNVLHIDDDEDDLEFFAAALENFAAKINCVSLTNASDALQQLVDKKLQPDVIFLDLNMPGMDGATFLTKFKKLESADIPVVILSTSGIAETANALKGFGAHSYLTKPSSMQDFTRILTPYFG